MSENTRHNENSTEHRTTRKAILSAINALGDDDHKVSVGSVIDRVAEETDSRLSEIFEGIENLLLEGEIYQPSPVTIRPVNPPVATDGAGTGGAIDHSFEEAEQQTVFVGDHVQDKDDDDDTTMLVVGTPAEPADEYVISANGMEPAETVADFNPDYPETDPVVEVVYTQRTDAELSTENAYAFPRSRLELVASIHDVDGDERGEQDA